MTEFEEAEYCINSIIGFISEHPNSEDVVTFYNHWVRDTGTNIKFQSNAVRVIKIIEEYKPKIAGSEVLRRYLSGRC